MADILAPNDPTRAARLRRASTHWLRRTVATQQAEARNPVHISSTISGTTYLPAEEDPRHARTKKARNAPASKDLP